MKFRKLLLLSVTFTAFISLSPIEEKVELTPIINKANEVNISSSSEVTNSEEGFTTKITEAWDTYIAPILTGVSITSIVSLIASIVFAILNHKNNNKSKLAIQQNRDEIVEIFQMYIKYKELSDKMLEELKNQNNLADDLRKEFSTKSTELIDKCNDVVNKTENLQSLKAVMIDLSTIISKVASSSDEMVAKGIASDVNKLEEHIRSL